MENNISNGFQSLYELIKLRWVPEILKSIDLGNHRYTDILDSIPFMSHTELNRKLNILIKRGVIKKSVDNNNTHYSLLNFGEDLVHTFGHLEDLEEKYFRHFESSIS